MSEGTWPIQFSMEKMPGEMRKLLTPVTHQHPESNHDGLLVSGYYSLSSLHPCRCDLVLKLGDRNIPLSAPTLAQAALERMLLFSHPNPSYFLGSRWLQGHESHLITCFSSPLRTRMPNTCLPGGVLHGIGKISSLPTKHQGPNFLTRHDG